MPSGPPELHSKWSNMGPYEGAGDSNAIEYLEKRGWKLDNTFKWWYPKNYKPTEEEIEAVTYLWLEWDYDPFFGELD